MRLLFILLLAILSTVIINNAHATPQTLIDIPMNGTITNYGTVSNSVTAGITPTYKAIINGAGINFTSGQYLKLSDKSQYDFAKTDPFSMEFIFKSITLGPLFQARSSVNYVPGYSVEGYNGQLLANVIATWGSDAVIVGSGTYLVDDGKVHYITITKTSGNPFTLSLYDNGTLINSATGSISGSIATTGPFTIGAGDGDSRQVTGLMAYFKLKNYQENQTEITNNFNVLFSNNHKASSLKDAMWMSDSLSYTTVHMPQNKTLSITDNISLNSQISTYSPPNYSRFNSTLFLTSNTNISYANIMMTMVDGFHNTNSFFSFVNALGTNNVSIEGNVTLNCGNLNRTRDVISGTYLVNGNNETMNKINVENCDHVGFYDKGFTNSKIENITVSKTISNGPAVGTGFAHFGGNNNIVKNIVSHDNCGNIGDGVQIEANDESLSPPEYVTNTQFIGISSYNNCGDGFITSNLGTGDILTGFNIHDNNNGIVLASGQPMTISHGEIWNSKSHGMAISSSGNTISNVIIGQDSNLNKTISGVIFYGPSGLTIDHATFINIPIGVEIQSGGVTIENSCFINVPTMYKVEAGGSVPTLVNNVC